MTSKEMKIAGSLSMASAFVTLPLAYLTFRLEGSVYSYAHEIQTFIQAAGTLLFIAIILYLKRFLNSLFSFHDTDKSIALMITASIVTGVVLIGAFSFPALKESLGSALIVILVAQGVVQAQFGYKLLRLPDSLGGLLKPFSYATMTTGICIVSVVLMPFGILASAVADLMLATIFFNMSRLVKDRHNIGDADA